MPVRERHQVRVPRRDGLRDQSGQSAGQHWLVLVPLGREEDGASGPALPPAVRPRQSIASRRAVSAVLMSRSSCPRLGGLLHSSGFLGPEDLIGAGDELMAGDAGDVGAVGGVLRDVVAVDATDDGPAEIRARSLSATNGIWATLFAAVHPMNDSRWRRC